MNSRDEDWGRYTQIVPPDADEGYAVAPALELRVVAGADKGARAALESERLGIGTADGNALQLRDSAVSRFHCEIVRAPEGLLLKDLDSTNGTYLEGFRIREAFLRPGARLRIAKTEIVCDSRGSVRLALPARDRFGGLLGASIVMRRVFGVLEKLAQSDASVLIEGETGTGKELVARALHDEGPRADGPFYVVDSGSIPAGLMESELFGHERGAFTGAAAVRVGAFEAADGGTLFLDEVGEMPVELQPKLLRALESRQIRRVGGTESRRVDVRVVAATNRDLRREVNRKTFRSDLYFRLAVVTVHVPPLRERHEDLPLLVEHFLADFGAKSPGEPPLHITPERLADMQRYPWPGNVRELRNYLDRAVALAAGGAMDASLPKPLTNVHEAEDGTAAPCLERPFGEAKAAVIEGFERSYLSALLERTSGNVSQAAREAHVDRAHLVGLFRKYGLR